MYSPTWREQVITTELPEGGQGITHDFVRQAIRKRDEHIRLWRKDTDGARAMLLERCENFGYKAVHGGEVELRVVPAH